MPYRPMRVVLLLLMALMPVRAQNAALESQVAELKDLVMKLQARVDQLEQRNGTAAAPVLSAKEPRTAEQTGAAPGGAPQTGTTPNGIAGLLGGTTVSFGMDGYYGYNFDNPIGRVNLLRAYDVSSNAFSLNQASAIFENAPDPGNGKRWGARLDLQFGQATETLQGNPANEPRPDIYRNVFQAYGTYVFPVGQGLTVDFGKFSSSLGMEGNYTKDQINYSRSFWFDYLPFYHMGVRASYKVNDALALNYWVVNGTQQVEAFNGYKDEFFGLTLTPSKNFTWNINYYLGQEHPDVIYYPNGGAPPNSPMEQGVPFTPIVNPPKGKLDIFDTYFNWQATPKLTLATELDYVVERLQTNSSPSHTDGGAAYLRYQITPKLALGARAEYLSDRGGLFSGTTQALKEGTLTLEYKLAEGFLFRNEWRTDASNRRYFYTDTLGVLRKQQSTATMGLVWWFGGKQGVW
jgi:Putative beta-barrel porin-2, OmpL-like. bbp2